MMNVVPDTQENRFDLALPAFEATASWIEMILQTPVPAKEGFRKFLASGEILCRLMNAVSPGTIKRINHCPNRAAAADNLTLFLSACEDKFGVLRSRLFSVADFEDILDRGNESPISEGKSLKHSEKVAIALFWFAKAIEQNPDCQDVPRLDYSAFAGLLPKPVIYHNPSCSASGDAEPRSKAPGTLERKTSYSAEQTLEPHHFIRPPSSTSSVNPMGNQLSNTLPKTDTVTSSVRPLLKTRAQTVPAQTNNHALDEDEWQADLDDWREKRRKAARLQATKMTSLEEQRQEDERRLEEAIRARMKQIKTQRTSVTSSYIPSTDISQPPPVSSPGMALLTGAVFDLSQVKDDDMLSEIEPYGPFRTTTTTDANDKSNRLESTVFNNGHLAGTSNKSPPPMANGLHDPIAQNGSPSDHEEFVKSQNSDVVASTPEATSHQLNGDSLPDCYRNVHIRLQQKKGTAESRWGMTIKAEGPTSTAPFVVERVKIGSSADVCDVIKGDVLVQLNGTILKPSPSAKNTPFTLSDLEQLMDQLTLSSKPTNLTVMRKVDPLDKGLPGPQNHELSDEDSIELSMEQKLDKSAVPNGPDAARSSSSDLDDTVVPVTMSVPIKPNTIEDRTTGLPTPVIRSRESTSVVQQMNALEADVSTVPVPSSLASKPRESSPVVNIAREFSPSIYNESQASETVNSQSVKPIASSYVQSVRTSLSTRIVETSEVGANHLNSPSQTDESDSQKSGAISNARHVTNTGTEPTYLSLVSTASLKNAPQTDYRIKTPLSSRKDTEFAVVPPSSPSAPKERSSSVSQPDHDSMQFPLPQTPSSPLPPPPPLPLSPSTSSSITTIPDQLKVEFHPTANLPDSQTIFQSVSESESESLSPVHRSSNPSQIIRVSDLPSPPPPQFFSRDVLDGKAPPACFSVKDQQPRSTDSPRFERPTTVHENGFSAWKSGTPDPKPVWKVLGDNAPVRVDLGTTARPPLTSYSGPHALRKSPPALLPATPPPAPSVPLVHHSANTRSPPIYPRSIPINDSEEVIIDDVDGNVNIYKRHEPPTRRYLPPPPPPVPSQSRMEAPPQPPRAPLDRRINPKNKCIACTRELGTGDLMIIESMSLYYHLACFVCSRCGVALSDGLSNTDVRIRCGQLYCNDCYPSRHTKATQQGGDSMKQRGSSLRNRDPSVRLNMPPNCTDRRSRPRSQLSQSRNSPAVSDVNLRRNY